jgi:2,3-dihydroxyphenylpropionate 1,2-dioxygenase
MQTALICASHSPLLYCYDKAPVEWDAIQTAYANARTFAEEFDPELVVIFGADHFNGFFLNLMPAFCIGLSAQATDDIGGFSGTLDVPEDMAMDCINYLRTHDIDTASSYQMTVDHAFSQTLNNMTGALDACPTIPVFINAITRPFVPFRRTRLLGETVGNFARLQNKRVLFLASGGMSHHPTRYYPAFGEGDESVSAWQLSGGKLQQSLTSDQWLDRLDSMHHEGAAMITRGERTAADMRLNADSDQRFLDVLLSGNLALFDQWDQEELVEHGGIGSMELQTWIAATSAHLACGGSKPTLDVYSVAPEIGIACGIVHA